MAVYAAATERARVGSAVLPLWTRNPALIASTFATLDLLAPGRIVLGLGAWWEPLATRVGVKRQKSVRAMREVIESVRLLLSMKEEVNYDGDYVHMEKLYLDHGGTRPHDVKIYIGAVGPQMLRLAGRIADGVLLNNNHTVGATQSAVDLVKQGAESAGRSLDQIERLKLLPVIVNRDKKRLLQEFKPRLALYLAQQPHIEGPTEADPELVQRIKAVISWPATQEQALEGAKLIPDQLAESLGCFGDDENVRSRLREYMDAGVTAPIASQATKETVDFLAEGGW
jgi:5,10-methylenetetrahydromethanopterin reductase